MKAINRRNRLPPEERIVESSEDLGMIDAGGVLAFYLSQGMTFQLVQLLMWELGTKAVDKMVPRRTWRDGLRRACLEPLKVEDPLQGALTLESFTAPVAPPQLEAPFADFRRAGRAPPTAIERAEDRAIALKQLTQILSHVERRCWGEKWCSRKEERLNHWSVTTYDLCAYVIRPATSKYDCSFVELLSVSGAPQPSDWFVALCFTPCAADLEGTAPMHSPLAAVQ